VSIKHNPRRIYQDIQQVERCGERKTSSTVWVSNRVHWRSHKASMRDASVLTDATVMCVIKKCVEPLRVASRGDTQVGPDTGSVLLFVTLSQSPLARSLARSTVAATITTNSIYWSVRHNAVSSAPHYTGLTGRAVIGTATFFLSNRLAVARLPMVSTAGERIGSRLWITCFVM